MDAIETTFSQAMAALDAPVMIVTAEAGGERAGCLVGFATQTSIHPPRFLVCISRVNRTYRVAVRAQALIVHLVPEAAGEIAELFGGSSGDDVDKFAAAAWRRGPRGAPLLCELGSWFAGTVVERVGLGDHVGFLLEPVAGAVDPAEGPPMRLRAAHRIAPGHPA